MQALGLIEVKGLIAAIESADAMTKSSNVNILEKNYVGGGLVSIIITGDVGAVKSAIDAGVSAVNMLNEEFLVSNHVIARPHEEIERIIQFEPVKDRISKNKAQIEEVVEIKTEVLENPGEEKDVAKEKSEEVKPKEVKKKRNKKDKEDKKNNI